MKDEGNESCSSGVSEVKFTSVYTKCMSGDERDNIVNVDFEWFDVEASDEQAIELLVRQLFDVDRKCVNVKALARSIVDQPAWGTTVKVNGRDGDTFAFISVLPLSMSTLTNEAIKQLTTYLINRSRTVSSLVQHILPLLEQFSTPSSHDQGHGHLGLILCERLLNMPVQVVPPMYKMLAEEIADAIDEKMSPPFTHYLILSRAYQEVSEEKGSGQQTYLNNSTAHERPRKKAKKVGKVPGGSMINSQIEYFHPEMEIIKLLSDVFDTFTYEAYDTNTKNDSTETTFKRAQFDSPPIAADGHSTFHEFGFVSKGILALIKADKLTELAVEMEKQLASNC